MLNHFRKSLRHLQTSAEGKLWQKLRNRQVLNHKFRRQHVLCGYIVDFVCLKEKLVIELDGEHHADRVNYDSERTLKLEEDGFKVLRFWNHEVFDSMDRVLEVIYHALKTP
jgi:crossover junction endodeoxyribonuclease RuvC